MGLLKEFTPQAMINLAQIVAREFVGATDLIVDRFPTGLCSPPELLRALP